LGEAAQGEEALSVSDTESDREAIEVAPGWSRKETFLPQAQGTADVSELAVERENVDLPQGGDAEAETLAASEKHVAQEHPGAEQPPTEEAETTLGPLALPPLEAGELIGGRYEVVEVEQPERAYNLYLVRDIKGYEKCWACDCESNTPEDTYCVDCGANMAEKTYRIREAPHEEAMGPEREDLEMGRGCSFIEGNRAYVLVEEPAIEFIADVQPRLAGLELEGVPFPDGMNLAVGYASHAGMLRDLNEDGLLTLELSAIYESPIKPIGLYIVADGMGGYEGGEVASSLAVRTLAEMVAQKLLLPVLEEEILAYTEEAINALLVDAVQLANSRVYQLARARGSNIGTTLTAALLVGETVHVANVGDSRAYFLNENGFSPITTDHSLVARLVAAGEITPDEVYTHPRRNEIFRFIGDQAEVDVDTFTRKFTPGSSLLLCSDGLWEMVRDQQIEEVLASADHPQATCDELVRTANENGGDDNITVIVVRAETTSSSRNSMLIHLGDSPGED